MTKVELTQILYSFPLKQNSMTKDGSPMQWGYALNA